MVSLCAVPFILIHIRIQITLQNQAPPFFFNFIKTVTCSFSDAARAGVIPFELGILQLIIVKSVTF